MLQSAAYFEEKGMFDKAVILYDKGDNTKRAQDLATEHKLFELLKNLTREMKESNDPEAVVRNADFLKQHNQHDKVIPKHNNRLLNCSLIQRSLKKQ